MDYEHIPIEKDLIPYQFELELEQEVFTFDIQYNEIYDFFTLDVYKNDELLVVGEKLVYGEPLFNHIYTPDFPAPTIIPYDPSNHENRITWENLNETVFLIIENGGDIDE